MECGGNRDGPHCEVCQPNHYISPIKDAYGRQPCLACDCDPTGTIIECFQFFSDKSCPQVLLTSSVLLMESASVNLE